MKSIQIEKNKWEKINKIVLRVDNVDLIYEQDLTINFVSSKSKLFRAFAVAERNTFIIGAHDA